MQQNLGSTGSPIFGSVSTTNNFYTNYITGLSTDLRINPYSTSGAIYLGHDSVQTLAYVGAGSTGTVFEVFCQLPGLGQVGTFTVNNNVVTTQNNTIDNGSGNMAVLGTLGVTGIATLNGGVLLPTATGIPTLLSYYERYLFQSYTTGPWTSPSVLLAFIFVRIGNTITCTSLADIINISTSGGSSANIVTTTAIPSRFCPGPGLNTSIHFITRVQANSAVSYGVVNISTASSATPGIFTFYSDQAEQVFQATGGNAGVYYSSWTWSI
jgi:hypothetical protein